MTDQVWAYLLSVNGKIMAKEIRVENSSAWPDYAIESNYKILSLEKLEQSIDKNKLLQGISSAKTIESVGFELGEMQGILVE